MKIVCAILSDNLDLCSAVAPIFSRIGAGSYLHFLDTFLGWGDDGRPSPGLAIDTRAVKLNVVGRQALPVRGNLNLIFSGEDANI